MKDITVVDEREWEGTLDELIELLTKARANIPEQHRASAKAYSSSHQGHGVLWVGYGYEGDTP